MADDCESMVVMVSHVESPDLFFCRLEEDLERLRLLSLMIDDHLVNQQENHLMPELSIRSSSIPTVVNALAYSSIHETWARARLISIKVDTDLKPLLAKVWFIDYGSIEFVTWKPNTIRRSTAEIETFNNDGESLCFPCSLFNVKQSPGNDDAHYIGEWTSYTNFLFKKLTCQPEKRFLLKKISTVVAETGGLQSSATTTICDLYPLLDSEKEESFPLSQQLVNAKVAQYIDAV